MASRSEGLAHVCGFVILSQVKSRITLPFPPPSSHTSAFKNVFLSYEIDSKNSYYGSFFTI